MTTYVARVRRDGSIRIHRNDQPEPVAAVTLPAGGTSLRRALRQAGWRPTGCAPGGGWGSIYVERQKILNEHWPLQDSKGQPHARGIPNQPNPSPVRARVEREGDGEEWVEATARRWTRQAVFVTFGDERPQTIGVWLRPKDVRRRRPSWRIRQ